jgi:RNA-directed DNA polymerase
MMWSRGHRFCLYADDIRVFVKSKRTAERVLDQCTKMLEKDLKLKVNREKSMIGPAGVATLLGYGFYFTAKGVKLGVAPKALKRAKARIKKLTSRKWSISMGERITLLNRYIRGWMGYFRLAETPKKFADLDQWFRRRMRQIRWKERKKPRTRVANLRKLGIPSQKAWEWGMTSKAYWRIAKSPILSRALPNEYWQTLGLVFLHDAWRRYRTT